MVIRRATRPAETAYDARPGARGRDRWVAAFGGSVLLLALAEITALWTDAVTTEHRLTSLLLAAGVAGLIGILAWSGVGPRRRLVRDLEDAEERYRAMVEQ